MSRALKNLTTGQFKTIGLASKSQMVSGHPAAHPIVIHQNNTSQNIMKIVQSALLVAAGLSLAGCQTHSTHSGAAASGAQSKVLAWEYKQMMTSNFFQIFYLNDLGKQGWVLCGLDSDQNSVGQRMYVFRRPIP